MPAPPSRVSAVSVLDPRRLGRGSRATHPITDAPPARRATRSMPAQRSVHDGLCSRASRWYALRMRPSHVGDLPVVLVVDDEPDNRALLCDILDFEVGCAVRAACNGVQAVAFLRD